MATTQMLKTVFKTLKIQNLKITKDIKETRSKLLVQELTVSKANTTKDRLVTSTPKELYIRTKKRKIEKRLLRR